MVRADISQWPGRLLSIIVLSLMSYGQHVQAAGEHQTHSERQASMALTITSPAFQHKGDIPARYSCDGDDISPELRWSDMPAGTKSLVLIVDDPDAPDPAAPKMTWVHWVLYNIPPDAGGLPEQAASAGLPPGTGEGLNDWKRAGYGGPCPPIGTHRYFFKLYALDAVLPDPGEATRAKVEQAMQGHILEQAELIGTYKRQR